MRFIHCRYLAIPHTDFPPVNTYDSYGFLAKSPDIDRDKSVSPFPSVPR